VTWPSKFIKTHTIEWHSTYKTYLSHVTNYKTNPLGIASIILQSPNKLHKGLASHKIVENYDKEIKFAMNLWNFRGIFNSEG
jgi:hypothetical protein